jgi:hypothetical protein
VDAYDRLQSQQPQSLAQALAQALADSPAGLPGWHNRP